MGIRQEQAQRYESFVYGVDDTSPIDSAETKGTLSVALNCDLVDDALVKKRNGYTVVNGTAWSGIARIRKGFEYVKSDGSLQNLVYGEANPVTGTSAKFGKITAPTITDIKTGLVDALQPSIVQFRSLAFVFNGTDDFIYDGTSTRQIGITAPVNAATFNTTINGNLNQSSNYLVIYTYRNSTTGAESSASPASAVMTTGGTAATDGLRVNVTAGDSATADQIRVYRTVAGGSTFFYDTDVAISATTADLVNSDATISVAGRQLEPDNSRLPEKAKYAIIQDNRVFVAGFVSNPNRVQYSKVGQNGSMPESFQAQDFVDCNITDGDKIIGLNRVNSVVLVLKQRSVGKLTPIIVPSSDPELAGSRKYVYEEIARDITGVSNEVFLSVDTFAIWLGTDDIYATDGSQIFRSSTSTLQTTTNGIARRILSTYRTINFTQKTKFSAVNKVDTQQILFSCPRSGQAESDFQFVAHYRNFPLIAFTYYSPGADTSTHPGITAASLFAATESNVRVYYFGDSGTSGKVYKLNSGTNDNGKGIYWDVRLPWDSNGDPSQPKLFHSYYLFAVGDGSGDSITHTFEREKLAIVVDTASTALALDPGSTWGAPAWGSFAWASTSLLPLRFAPHLKAHYGRYGFNNINADQPMSVIGLLRVVTGVPIRR
jgi:hypothetical protein